MNTINNVKEQYIDTMGFRIEKGMAFDGCNYYIPVQCQETVLKYNIRFEQVCRIHTTRDYSSICYDCKEHCFWASASRQYRYIYKLDLNFKEYDSISLGYEFYGVISGISYCFCDNSLLISSGDRVLKLSKDCEQATTVYTAPKCVISGVLSIGPGMLLTVFKDNHYYIYILNGCHKCPSILCIPNDFSIQTIICKPSISCYGQIELITLALKRGSYAYILTQTPSDCVLEFISDCHDQPGCPPRCKNCNSNCPDLCPFYYDCPSDSNCCNGKEKIMESVALMETALSHIINAEGERLQKILTTTNDIDKILCANREISQTLINATHLEHVLYAKLQAIDINCCDSATNPCCDPCDKEGEVCKCDVNGGKF